MVYYIISDGSIFYFIILYHIILCHIILYYIMIYYISTRSTATERGSRGGAPEGGPKLGSAALRAAVQRLSGVVRRQARESRMPQTYDRVQLGGRCCHLTCSYDCMAKAGAEPYD